MTQPRILSVGHCGFDHAQIARQLAAAFQADVTPADTQDEALEALRGTRFDLVLVNRTLDADGGAGLELIKALKADPELAPVPVMLVSNYPDAQKAAQSLGAHPGFGKAQLSSPGTVERIRRVLGVGQG